MIAFIAIVVRAQPVPLRLLRGRRLGTDRPRHARCVPRPAHRASGRAASRRARCRRRAGAVLAVGAPLHGLGRVGRPGADRRESLAALRRAVRGSRAAAARRQAGHDRRGRRSRGRSSPSAATCSFACSLGTAVELFLAGRLNEPLGYVNGQAGLLLVGVWPLVALAERARQPWLAGAARRASARCSASCCSARRGRCCQPSPCRWSRCSCSCPAGRAARGCWWRRPAASPSRSGRCSRCTTRPPAASPPTTADPGGGDRHPARLGACGRPVGCLHGRWPGGRARLGSPVAGPRRRLGAARDPVPGPARSRWPARSTIRSTGARRVPLLHRAAQSTGRLDPLHERRRQPLRLLAGRVAPVRGRPAARRRGRQLRPHLLRRAAAPPRTSARRTASSCRRSGELGLVGRRAAAPFLAAVGFGFARRARAARVDLRARGLAVAAGGAFAVWLVQTSVDWLHLIPGVTGIVLCSAAVLVGPWRSERAPERGTSADASWSRRAPSSWCSRRCWWAARRSRTATSSEGRDLLASDPAAARRQGARLASTSTTRRCPRTTSRRPPGRGSTTTRGRAARSRRGPAREPHDFVTWALLGDLATRRGDDRQALRDYRRALRAQSAQRGARRRRGGGEAKGRPWLSGRQRRAFVCLLIALARPGRRRPPSRPARSRSGGRSQVNGVSQFPIYRDLGVGIYQTRSSGPRSLPRARASRTDPTDPAYRWPAEIDLAVRGGARARDPRLADC